MAAAAASSPSLAGASGLLFGTTVFCMLLGALIGWVSGSWGLGLLIGAIIGIPMAVGVVYRVYAKAPS